MGIHRVCYCFNPLDRVKFVQIKQLEIQDFKCPLSFQSPRSGQICSNCGRNAVRAKGALFQSPRSGQICSNLVLNQYETVSAERFNPLDRVKFVQMKNVPNKKTLRDVSIP